MSFARPDSFMEVLHQGVREEVRKIIEEETEKASKEVERRLKAKADTLGLSLLSRYNMEMRADHLIITVKKE